MQHVTLIFLFSAFTLFAFGQTSQRIIAENTDGVAIEGNSVDSVGVLGISQSGPGVRGEGLNSFSNGVEGVGFTFGVYGECSWDLGSGVRGESTLGKGVSGESSDDSGIYGKSTESHGVWAQSVNEFGLYAESFNGTGGYFKGGNGVAIELAGTTSPYTSGDDDAVIKVQASQTNGDLILSSNDIIEFYLDDDNNSAAEYFSVYNGSSSEIFELDTDGNLSILGAYSSSSDRNRKENITMIDENDILTKIASLPISEWQFIAEETRHIGPMAQDFYSLFGYGPNDRTISTVDADGVALAAIKALKNENDALRSMIFKLQERLDRLEYKKQN